MLQDTVEGSWREINTWLSGNCNGTRLLGMFELTMTASSPRKIPTVFFKKSDEVLHFHEENDKLFGEQEEDAERCASAARATTALAASCR